MCGNGCLTSYAIAPNLLFSIAFIGLFGIYGWALSLGHVEKVPSWPFIAEIGAKEPERGVFTLLLIAIFLLLLYTIFMFYWYMKERSGGCGVNQSAFFFGMITCVGAIVAFSFDVKHTAVMYYIGVILAFGGATAYLWTVVVLGFRYSNGSNSCVLNFRLVLGFIESVNCVILFIAELLSKKSMIRAEFAAASEWSLVIILVIFVATLADELARIEASDFRVVIRSESLPITNSGVATPRHSSSSSSSSDDDNY